MNVAAPCEGLGRLCVAGQTRAGAIFQWTLPRETQRDTLGEIEVYVRGEDLIASYDAAGQEPFRAQVDWRALTPNNNLTALGGVDLIASVQTQLLDSHPELTVSTSLAAGELLALSDADAGVFEPVVLKDEQPVELAAQSGAGCVLYRLSAADSAAPPCSYAEMIHPSDVGPVTIRRDPTGLVRLEHRLFSSFLEKGVILRARLRGVFLEQALDETAALAWYRALVENKLPLTA